jgi:D-alanine-D-alanine ligase
MSERLVVLFGGNSEERRVSVASAQHVCSRLSEAEPVFETTSGALFRCPREHLAAFQDAFVTDYAPPGSASWANLTALLDDPTSRDTTFFLAYHGQGGEDGQAQRLFEARRIAFTGSASQASADAFDKDIAKRKARDAGIRTAASIDLPRDEAGIRAALNGLLQKHSRAVAKPTRGGSSVGLYHVRASADVDAASKGVAASGLDYLAEEFVAGRELTVGVVQSLKGLRALPPSEVRVDPGRAFDYEGKYLARGTTEITPADVPPEVTRAVQELAMGAHRALGCEGYSRTDIIVTDSGPVFLEINTLPGMTRASFLPQQLEAERTPIVDFLRSQLDLARARRDRTRSS